MADADAEPKLATGEAEAAAETEAVVDEEAKVEDKSEEPLSSDEEADRLVANAVPVEEEEAEVEADEAAAATTDAGEEEEKEEVERAADDLVVTTAAICSAVASPQRAGCRPGAAAACTSSFQSQATARGGRRCDSCVSRRSAVGRSRPTATLRARRCAHTFGGRTMPAMHCACVLTAVHCVLVQSSPPRSSYRSSHRARPTALDPPRSSLRAHPSALIPPRDCCAHVCRLSVRLLKCCTSARLLLPHNLIIFSEFKSCNFCTWRDHGVE